MFPPSFLQKTPRTIKEFEIQISSKKTNLCFEIEMEAKKNQTCASINDGGKMNDDISPPPKKNT